MDRHRIIIAAVTVAVVVLAFVPAAVVFGLGWLSLGHPSVPAGLPTPPSNDTPEQWVLFSLFYMVWVLGLVVLLIWAYDRLDYHYVVLERKAREPKKRVRRRLAGMRLLAGQQQARAQAAAEKASVRRRRPPEQGPPGEQRASGAQGDQTSRDHEESA